MKKTFIALLTLASSAFGMNGAEFNTIIVNKLTDASYTLGDAYTISAELSSMGNLNKDFVTLADSYYIVNQGHVYWGLNNKTSNDLTNNKLWELTVSGNNYTYTSEDGKRPVLWTQNAEGSGSATRVVGKALTLLVGSDGTDSWVQLSYTGSDIVDRFVLKGTRLDASDIIFADDIGSVENYVVSVTKSEGPAVSVPEPTTATLSLLALAGLAARRRRK